MRNADAARLLAAARSADALLPLVRALGFDGRPEPVARDAAATLAARFGVRTARIVPGRGADRALIAESSATLDGIVHDIASHLPRIAPTCRWLVALSHGDGAGVALAVPRVERGTVRVAVLRCDPRRVLPSDAETVCALAAAIDAPERWIDLLGRDALTRRFYRRLEGAVRALGATARGVSDPAARAELALLHASRLLFLAFLEAKGWLDGDHAFLRRTFDASMATGGDHHARVLRPLFFGTLNTPWARRAPVARAFGRVPFLNGGLFAPTALERRHRALRLDDAALGAVVVDLLGKHRFTPREESGALTEAAVDPEMLGRAFESLMSAGTRHVTGAFYTPQPLVAHVTREALRTALADGEPNATVDGIFDGAPPPPSQAAALRARLVTLRVLDPACGSGAFLVHALERVSALLARCGDGRPTAAIRRDVLARSIFGVDVNPTAVWLCELRLWLSVVVESDEADAMAVAPLPNLDRHVRVGDALASASRLTSWGGDPWGSASGRIDRAGERVARLRERYARAAGRRKATLGSALAAAERSAAVAALDRLLAARRAERAELLAAARGRDLFGARRGSAAAERRRLDELRAASRALAARRQAVLRGGALPFGFAWHFPDLAARGGCDIVLGNPPWVRPHALGAAEREALRASYATVREAAWTAGAEASGAGAGFASQADLAAPFVERSLALARPGGAIALLVPAKLWRSLAGGGVRRLLARESTVRVVEDWTDAPALFDAAVYPSLVVAVRDASRARGAESTIRVHGTDGARAWRTCADALPLDDTPGSPWLLVPPTVRQAVGALRSCGVPLGASGLAQLRLGVKCGRNAAFLVRVVRDDGELATVEGVWPDGGVRHGAIERALLRPALRGVADDAARIVWPYDGTGHVLATLPPNALRWLAPWRGALAARSDARHGRGPWWTLFRTAAADSRRARVVWADVARTLQPRLLPPGDPTVPLNSCYVLQCDRVDDATALARLLASPIANGWCAALAEPARGGYRRHLAWTVALLPIPREWAAARAVLVAERVPSLAVLAEAYGVPVEVLGALCGK